MKNKGSETNERLNRQPSLCSSNVRERWREGGSRGDGGRTTIERDDESEERKSKLERGGARLGGSETGRGFGSKHLSHVTWS